MRCSLNPPSRREQCFYKETQHTQFFEILDIFNLILFITCSSLKNRCLWTYFWQLNYVFAWDLQLMSTFACSFFRFSCFYFSILKSKAILRRKKFLTAYISEVIGNSGVIFLDYQKWKIKSLNLHTWLACGDHLCAKAIVLLYIILAAICKRDL